MVLIISFLPCVAAYGSCLFFVFKNSAPLGHTASCLPHAIGVHLPMLFLVPETENGLSLRARVVWCACALLPYCRHTWVLPLLPWVLCGWVPGAGPCCVPGAPLQHPGGSSPEVGAQALPYCQQEPEPGRDVPLVRARCDFGSDVGQEWLPRLCPSTGEGWELPTENR